MGLLIDASNSVRDRFKFEQESAIEFLNQTIRRRVRSGIRRRIRRDPEVTQDFTDDTEKLAQGVHELRPGGGTALYDAIYFACRDKLMKGLEAPTCAGLSFCSVTATTTRAMSPAKRPSKWRNAPRPSSTTSAPTSAAPKGPGDKILERIADATGGRAFFPFQIRDVVNAFAEIQEELRSQYAVSYSPADLKHGRPLSHDRNRRQRPQEPARAFAPRLVRPAN